MNTPFRKSDFREQGFRKASRSMPDKECVRVDRRNGWVAVRDDKTLFGSADDQWLVLSEAEFDAWIEGEGDALVIDQRADALFAMRRSNGEIELTFTEAEIVAFRDGIAKGEFSAAAFATA